MNKRIEARFKKLEKSLEKLKMDMAIRQAEHTQLMEEQIQLLKEVVFLLVANLLKKAMNDRNYQLTWFLKIILQEKLNIMLEHKE